MSNQGFREGPQTYLNAETGVITANSLVTLGTVEGTVLLCGVEGSPIGVADGDVAAGAYGNFMPMEGRVMVKSSAAITAGMLVKADAAGEVVKGDTGTAITMNEFIIGQAETGDTGPSSIFIVCK